MKRGPKITSNGIERNKAIKNGDKFYFTFCKQCGIETKYFTKANSVGGQCTQCSGRYFLRKSYDITDVEWLQMYDEQGGKCANSVNSDCEFTHHNRWWEQGAHGFNVDHDHETGVIRGLLCSTCNMIEGMLDNHPEKMEGLKVYKQNEGFPFSFPKFTIIKNNTFLKKKKQRRRVRERGPAKFVVKKGYGKRESDRGSVKQMRMATILKFIV